MNFKQINKKESDWDSSDKFGWCESVANVAQLAMWFSNKLFYFLLKVTINSIACS